MPRFKDIPQIKSRHKKGASRKKRRAIDTLLFLISQRYGGAVSAAVSKMIVEELNTGDQPNFEARALEMINDDLRS